VRVFFADYLELATQRLS